jgi:hypothetical protein
VTSVTVTDAADSLPGVPDLASKSQSLRLRLFLVAKVLATLTVSGLSLSPTESPAH